MAIHNPRYPNAFEIVKVTTDGKFGGGTQTEDVFVTGNCSLQKGGEDTAGENKLLTYDWRICFRFNDNKSVVGVPPDDRIGTDCTVKVTDSLGQQIYGNILRVTPQEMGVDVYFNEETANKKP